MEQEAPSALSGQGHATSVDSFCLALSLFPPFFYESTEEISNHTKEVKAALPTWLFVSLRRIRASCLIWWEAFRCRSALVMMRSKPVYQSGRVNLWPGFILRVAMVATCDQRQEERGHLRGTHFDTQHPEGHLFPSMAANAPQKDTQQTPGFSAEAVVISRGITHHLLFEVPLFKTGNPLQSEQVVHVFLR